MLNGCTWLLLLIILVNVNCDALSRLEKSLNSSSINVDQIVNRVKTRTGIKNLVHCIRPRRRTVNKEIVIYACKLESALNALRVTVSLAKDSRRFELIQLAKEQLKEVDILINIIEAILNF